MHVVEPDRCGNSPRLAIIRDFVASVAAGDFSAVADRAVPDMSWEIVGVLRETGLKPGIWPADGVPVELTFYSTITHGREGSADGEIVYADGTRQHFSHVISFTGAAKTARIQAMRSYITT